MSRRDRSALDSRDRALLVLAGAIVIVAMVCVTVLVLWSTTDGVAAGIGVFTGACTVSAAAVGRIGPARTVDPAPLTDPPASSVADDLDGDIFTTPEVP